MRIVYFGTFCTFSIAPLRILIEAGCEVGAVVIPADRSMGGQPIARLTPAAAQPIPITAANEEPSIVSLAWEQQAPVYQVNQLAAPETLETLRQLRVEVACVACFPKRIPAALLTALRQGFLNVHPALLPDYRGPHPLFWMFRNGDHSFGVTVHFMDEQWDTGDIAAQARVDLPDGVSGEEADWVLAQYGGELLVEVLHALERGTLLRRAQSGGSYYPAPQDKDFVIEPGWSARQAFNFMRGAAGWGRLYPIELAGRRFWLRQAYFYVKDEVLGEPYRVFGDQIDIQFAPGVLRAQHAQIAASPLRGLAE